MNSVLLPTIFALKHNTGREIRRGSSGLSKEELAKNGLCKSTLTLKREESAASNLIPNHGSVIHVVNWMEAT